MNLDTFVQASTRAWHRWNLVCVACYISRKLCVQDKKCQEAESDHLLPWCYAEHDGQGKSVASL